MMDRWWWMIMDDDGWLWSWMMMMMLMMMDYDEWWRMMVMLMVIMMNECWIRIFTKIMLHPCKDILSTSPGKNMRSDWSPQLPGRHSCEFKSISADQVASGTRASLKKRLPVESSSYTVQHLAKVLANHFDGWSLPGACLYLLSHGCFLISY